MLISREIDTILVNTEYEVTCIFGLKSVHKLNYITCKALTGANWW